MIQFIYASLITVIFRDNNVEMFNLKKIPLLTMAA